MPASFISRINTQSFVLVKDGKDLFKTIDNHKLFRNRKSAEFYGTKRVCGSSSPILLNSMELDSTSANLCNDQWWPLVQPCRDARRHRSPVCQQGGGKEKDQLAHSPDRVEHHTQKLCPDSPGEVKQNISPFCLTSELNFSINITSTLRERISLCKEVVGAPENGDRKG